MTGKKCKKNTELWIKLHIDKYRISEAYRLLEGAS